MVAASWSELGYLYCELGQYKKARHAYNQSAHILGHTPEDPLNFDRLVTPSKLENLLELKSAYFEKREYLDSLIMNQSYELALQDFLQKSLQDKNSRQSQMSKAYPIVEKSIKSRLIRNRREDVEKAFEYSEKNKSRLLRESLRLNGLHGFPGLPDSVREQELQLNQSLTEYEKKVFQLESEGMTDSLSQALRDSIFELKKRQETLIQHFESSYPDYYMLKYQQNLITVNQIQQKLKTNECLIEYFVGDSTLFLFGINQKQFLVKEIPLDFPLNKWIEQFRKGIYEYWMTFDKDEALYLATKTLYSTKAYQLYEKLLKPVTEILTERLIIIPDGNLGLLPFNALISKPTDPSIDFSDFPYLLNDHIISYDFSATLHWRNSIKKKRPKKLFAGFAPQFNSSGIVIDKDLELRRNDLGPLLFNMEEIQKIKSIYGGKLFLREEATIQQFKEHAKEYRLLHLATHGKSNNRSGEYSFVAFQEVNDSVPGANHLYVSELYNIDLAADLVVLSACETGLGEMKRGEGIVGLATGFTLAGAQSVMPSLWSISDRVTADFMEDVYSQFYKGLSKDEALANAQRNMLKNPSSAAPYYWAAFIPIGNMDPLPSNNSYFWLVGLGFILFLVVVAFYLRMLDWEGRF